MANEKWQMDLWWSLYKDFHLMFFRNLWRLAHISHLIGIIFGRKRLHVKSFYLQMRGSEHVVFAKFPWNQTYWCHQKKKYHNKWRKIGSEIRFETSFWDGFFLSGLIRRQQANNDRRQLCCCALPNLKRYTVYDRKRMCYQQLVTLAGAYSQHNRSITVSGSLGTFVFVLS